MEHDGVRLLYVSDIHIENRFYSKERKTITWEDAIAITDKIVDDLVYDFELAEEKSKILLVGGDVSHTPKLIEHFYNKMASKIGGENIVSILGNHELMFHTKDQNQRTFDQVLDFYKKLFEELNINFLNNSLFVLQNDGSQKIIDGDCLISMSAKELNNTVSSSKINIFGGTGFCGKRNYRENNNTYDTTLSHSEEIILSQIMEETMRSIQNATMNVPVVVFSHMPPNDWTNESPNPHWIYIHGHDHKNKRIESSKIRVFADGQRYRDSSVHPSCAYSEELGTTFEPRDILADIPDGIHKINRYEYVDFFHRLGIEASYNLSDSVTIICRDGYRLFIQEKPRSIQILRKGSHTTTKHNVDYFYKMIPVYVEAVKKHTSNYFAELEEISNFVKMIGGDGKIDGCNVWIDETFRICLNPDLLTITPFYYYSGANECRDMDDMISQCLDKNIPELYEKHRKEWSIRIPKMYDNSWRDPRPHNIIKMNPTINKYRDYRMLLQHKIILFWDNDLMCDINNCEVDSKSILNHLK